MKDYITHKFLKLLDENDIKYHYEGRWNWLIVTGNVFLSNEDIGSLPNKIKFNNKGSVSLPHTKLTTLPNHIEFNNGGDIFLFNNSLTSLPDGIKFNNKGLISLSNNLLTSLPNDIEFNNYGKIYLYDNPLESLPDNIDEFYDILDDRTKEYIQERFPDHWIVDKERFGL